MTGISRAQSTRIWSKRTPNRDSKPWFTQQRNGVWSAVCANDVVVPYYFNNHTSKGVKYNQMLYTYNWSEAPKYPQNAVTQLSRAPPHIKNPISSLLYAMVLISWIGKCAPLGWPARSLNQPSWTSSFVDWGKTELFWFESIQKVRMLFKSKSERNRVIKRNL